VGYYRTLLLNCAAANGAAKANLRHAQTMVPESALPATDSARK
jgi:hypothetical protein